MEEKKRNNRIILAIIGIIMILGIIGGVTYAYFNAQAESEVVTITSGSMKIKFTDGALINATDIEPIKESEILTKATKKSFGISKESSSGSNMYARIDLTDLVVSENFQNYDLKWALYEGSTKITTGSFVTTSDGSDSINMATNVLIDSTVEKNYNLYIWIQETGIDQSEMMDGSISGKITVTGQKDKLNTLASNILKETINENPTFSTTSTDRGLFVQKDDSEKSNYGFPTYYYRGNVINNYVTFAGQTWRIVRINEDSSIRLIRNTSLSILGYSISVNNEFDEPCWGSYTTQTCNSNYKGSYIESELNTWYSNNIENNNDLNSKITVGSYCNDNSTEKNRYLTNNPPAPIFTCPNEQIVVNSKIGLITADEAVYTGTVDISQITYEYTNDGRSYLSTIGMTWTMTRYSDYVLQWLPNWSSLSYMEADGIATAPVINLKSDVIVTSGTGTSSDPYIIK